MTVRETWSEPRPVRLTIEDFLCLLEAGAFRNYSKTELIDGQIVAIDAQFSLHARAKSLLLRRLADAVESHLPHHEVWSEVAVAVRPDRLPEPDIVITRFVASKRAPVPVETVPLLIEVADTTLAYDLGTKAPLYAAAGVPEYWIVDLEGRVVHRMWSPVGSEYRRHDTIAFGEPLAAVTIAGLKIGTEGL